MCDAPPQNYICNYKNIYRTHTQLNKEATMDFDDKGYKTIIYIDKNNQVVIKFNGFQDKNEADTFSQFISWELGIEGSHYNTTYH